MSTSIESVLAQADRVVTARAAYLGARAWTARTLELSEEAATYAEKTIPEYRVAARYAAREAEQRYCEAHAREIAAESALRTALGME